MNFLDKYIICGNTLYQILLTIILLVIGAVLIYFIKKKIIKAICRRRTETSSVFWKSLINKNVFPIALLILIRTTMNILTLPTSVIDVANILTLALLISSFGFGISHALVWLAQDRFNHRLDEGDKINFSHWLSVFIKIIVWGIAILLLLDNIGVKITSLVTVLGIGGIALAFAAQTLISDIFCFFTIFLDRPFIIGDFVQVGAQSGVIEHIGIKTTRLRSLDGEQIVFANTDITKARVHNYKSMVERRVLFHLGIVYETPSEKLECLPTLLRQIVEERSGAKFGRAHFIGFRDYYLEYEVVYFIQGNDYDLYLDIQHQVNIEIVKKFEEEDIRFAYPTTDLNIKQWSKSCANP